MQAMVWELHPRREKLPFKVKKALQGFIWLLIGTFSMGMVSLFIASYLYVPFAVKTLSQIIGGL
jgi:cobalamin biosynthesis protein CobD/CbiB